MNDTNVNLILVDDDPDAAALLRHYVRDIDEWDATLVHFTDAENGRAEISRREDIDVIVLDYSMGAVSGLDLLNDIRKSGDIRPVIVLTGQTDQNTVAELMSHELRTPLNAIIGFSQGLLQRIKKHPLNDHQISRLSRIQESGQHLLSLN